MNLSTLKYYINKEKLPIQRIFINITDWEDLLKQVGLIVRIHIGNYFYLENICIHRNVHQSVNYAKFVILNGNPDVEESYSNYDIEILTEEEKIIKNILE